MSPVFLSANDPNGSDELVKCATDDVVSGASLMEELLPIIAVTRMQAAV
jgi:hypothetical protein